MTQLKTVDPVEMATATSTAKKSRGKEQLPEVTIGEKLRSHVARFCTFATQRKQAVAQETTYRTEILNWAKAEFVKRLIQKQFGNFLITNGTEDIQFVVQAKGRSFGDVERKTLTESHGADAAQLLEPAAEVSLNLDVWNQHKETLRAALNATDANGERLVHEDILKALFYRPLVVKPSVIEDAVRIAGNDEVKLGKLLFEDLNLTCSLTAK